MPDLDRAFDQLAPEVDLAASRALFERHRGLDVRPRAPRRGLVGIAAALVVLLGVAAFAIAAREPDIALQTAEQVTTSVDATVASPSEDGEDEIVADVELPPVGEARSFLLDDGFPLWVVHHGDGTASAVPGVAPEPVDLPGDGSNWVPTGNWDVIQWVESGWFRGLAGYDAWGRALAQLPDAAVVDLTGFVAEVHGDRVLVRRSGADDILGDPVLPTGWPDSANGPAVEPVLPVVASIDALPTGWSKVDVDVVTSTASPVSATSRTSS